MLLSGEVQIFFRKLDDMTGTYPDCAAAILRCFKSSQVRCEALNTICGTLIVDAEIVLIVYPDPSAADLPTDIPRLARPNGKGKVLPFLALSTRKRTEVTAESATVRVKCFAFDVLFLGGVSLLKTPFAETPSAKSRARLTLRREA